jgi:hypothetical protein
VRLEGGTICLSISQCIKAVRIYADVHASRLLHADVGIPTVREEITNISWKYIGKVTTHTNELATILLRK